MTEPLITMVYPANVGKAWPFLYPILEPAVSRTPTHNMEDLRRAIMGGQAQLWVQWKDAFEAAVVTEFAPYPQGIWYRLWLAGAREGTNVDWKQFYAILRKFSYDNGCRGLMDCGRKGWDEYCPEEVKNMGIMRIMTFPETTGEIMKAG